MHVALSLRKQKDGDKRECSTEIGGQPQWDREDEWRETGQELGKI